MTEKTIDLGRWQAPPACGARSIAHWWPADLDGPLSYTVTGDTVTLTQRTPTQPVRVFILKASSQY